MSFTLTGLSATYAAGTPTRAFTITYTGGGNPGSTATYALDDASAGGVFFPSSITIGTTGPTSHQFVYIAPSGASSSITVTATASGGDSGSHSLTLPNGAETQLFNDTFTGSSGTNLSAHTSDSGGTWSESWNPSSGSVLLTGSNAVRPNAAVCQYESNAAVGSASEIDVVAILKVFDLSVNGFISLGARSTSTTGTINTYLLGFTSAIEGWQLNVYISGSATTLIASGSTLTPTPTTGDTLTLAFRYIDTLQYLFPLYNGVLIVAPVQNSSLTAGTAGVLGLFTGTPSNTAGLQISQFSVNQASSGLPPATFTFPATHVFESPGSFRLSGTSIIATTGGPYLKFSFSASTQLTLNIDTSLNSGLSANQMPSFRVIIDDGVETFVQAGTTATQVFLGTGLTTGTHYCRIDILGGDIIATDNWAGTISHTKIDSIQLDNGGTLSDYPSIRPKRAMIFGDSYLAAYFGATMTGPNYNFINFTRSFGQAIAFAFKAEMGQQGIGSCGWVAIGNGGFPAFPSWWNFYDSGNSRTFPTLDYLWVCIGFNDVSQTDANVTAAVTSFLPAARTALSGTKIFIVIPPNGTKRSAITVGFNASKDANMYLIDIGDELAPALNLSAPSWVSPDAIHMYQYFQSGLLGSAIAAETQAAIGGGGSSSPFVIIPNGPR